MGTSFEDILNRMRNAPHAGVPAVTNPKVPTKVERDTEAATERRRAMPNFNFGTGNKMEQLLEHMKSAPHPTPTRPDPSFNPHSGSPISKADFDTYAAIYKEFLKQVEQEEGQKEVTMQVR